MIPTASIASTDIPSPTYPFLWLRRLSLPSPIFSVYGLIGGVFTIPFTDLTFVSFIHINYIYNAFECPPVIYRGLFQCSPRLSRGFPPSCNDRLRMNLLSNQSLCFLFNDHLNQPINDHFKNQAINDHLNQPINDHLNQPINDHLNQPINDHLNQPINRTEL